MAYSDEVAAERRLMREARSLGARIHRARQKAQELRYKDPADADRVAAENDLDALLARRDALPAELVAARRSRLQQKITDLGATGRAVDEEQARRIGDYINLLDERGEKVLNYPHRGNTGVPVL